MSVKVVLGLLFFIFAMSLLAVYWFVPLSTTEFRINAKPSNPNLDEVDLQKLQFYSNMRFPDEEISYRITRCPLQKMDNMVNAFNILSDKTLLSFYWDDINPEIEVFCDSTAKIEGNLFIAGEGGPTNITTAGEFNVITKGKITLLRESKCPNPNIGLHELLHVLGFDHTNDPTDIMYPVSDCDQELKNYTLDLINTLYSIPSKPDLAIENVSAIMHGKYLDLNLSVRNVGLKPSPESKVVIYADDTKVKEFRVEALDIGHGRIISFTNLWVARINTGSIRLEVVSNSEELKKENNELILEIKK